MKMKGGEGGLREILGQYGVIAQHSQGKNVVENMSVVQFNI